MAKAPSDELQSRAVKHVTELSNDISTLTVNLRKKWLRYYELYRLFKTREGRPWNSKLFIPKVFEVVEKIAPRMTSSNPEFTAVPKNDKSRPLSRIVSDYLSFIWDSERLKPQMRLLAKAMLIYGTAIAKVDWRQQTEKEVEEFETEEGEFQETKEIVKNETPRFTVVDIFDFQIDPREESIESAIGVIHKRDNVQFKELLENDDIYFNLDRVKMMLKGLTSKNRQETEQQTKFTDQGISDQDVQDDNRLNIKEYWGRFSKTGDVKDEVEYIITTVNDSILIRFEKNELGMRPFVAVKDHPVPNEFYGIGEVQPIESLQVEMNWIRNQRMDNVNLALNNMWLIDNDSGVNPSQLESRPGNAIFTNPGSRVEPLQIKDVTSSSYAEADRINRDIQTVTSTIDTTEQGGQGSFTNTATGERIRASEQNVRFQAKIENLEEGISEIGRKMLILTAELADQDIVIRRLTLDGGFEFTTIPQEVFRDINNKFNIKIETASTTADSSFDRRNDNIAIWNLTLQAAQAGVQVDLTEVWTRMMEKGFGITSPQELLIPEGEQGAPNPLEEEQPNL